MTDKSKKLTNSVLETDIKRFTREMAAPPDKIDTTPRELINENDFPPEELIHPLTISLDTKKHPDMMALPMAYKTSRNLFKELIRLTQK